MSEKQAATLPTREDISVQYKWKLGDIYPSEEQWEDEVRQVRQLIEDLQRLQGTLTEGAGPFKQCIQTVETARQLASRVYSYAMMRSDENTADSEYQAMIDKARGLYVALQGAASFIGPEILAMPPGQLDQYLDQDDELKVYRHYLDEILRQKEHLLSPDKERLLAEAGDMAQGASNAFTMLNNADLKFCTIKDENGKEVEVTKGRYVRFQQSKDRRVRHDSFKALYGSYWDHKNTLAATLAGSVKKDLYFSRARRYQSSLEAALDADNIDTSVYDNLISAVADNLESMHRYIALRKRTLGVDELHMYDLYVPITPEVDIDIPYPEATDAVTRAVAPLGRDYQDQVRNAFASRWVDVYETQGKRSGAYSNGSTYGAHPFILLNYQGSMNDMFTVAHEMGHAMHSLLSSKNQPYVYSNYSIFVAEVASTVNEGLLFAYLLEKTTDKQKRAYILNNHLEQFRGTLYRQTMFAEFEKIAHGMAGAGEALTPQALCSVYHDLNVKYYGPEVVVDEDVDIEWARIPHFYRYFYVYKYATGFSAAVTLAKQILEEGQPAIDRYIGFLSSGSSDYPLEVLKQAGVDMSTPDPVNQALGVFAGVVTDLEESLG